MADFADSPTSLVADVDCTTEGKELCEQHGVKGYPSIKYGDPLDLKDFNGERNYEALKKFADENLGPSCGPANTDLCTAEQKALISKLQAFSPGKLQGKINNMEKQIEKLAKDYEAFIEDLKKQVDERQKKRDADIQAIKDKGLAYMKMIQREYDDAEEKKRQEEEDKKEAEEEAKKGAEDAGAKKDGEL